MIQDQLTNKMVFLEFDGYHHWEKYLMSYQQALTLIPILLPKLPSITLTDYEHSKIQGEIDKEETGSSTIRDTNNEGII